MWSPQYQQKRNHENLTFTAIKVELRNIKKNKSEREGWRMDNLTFMWNIRKQSKGKIVYSENKP